MPRQRHQRGRVEKTESKPYQWNGRWAIYVIGEDGKEKRKTREKLLGLCSEMTKADAEEKLRLIIRKETNAPSSGDMTLWEFMNKPETGYIALKSKSKNWSLSWRASLNAIFDNHFKDSIGKVRLCDLTPTGCQAWLNAFDTAKYSQSMIHKARTQLGAMLMQAFMQELISGNFAQMFNKRGALEEPESQQIISQPTLSLEQIAKGLAVTSRYRSKRDYLIFRLASTIGLRPNEVFALRANDIHGNQLMIDEGVVQNVVGKPKTKKSKAPVPLTAELRGCLEVYIASRGLRGEDFLFPYSTGRPMNQNNYVKRQLKTLGGKIGVPGLDFRMLRRSFATYFAKHGDPKELQSVMRHSDITMSLEVYQQEIPEKTMKAMESFEREIMSLAAAA